MSEPLVLVTGASGFIATHVIQQLQEAGHRVRGTVRSLKDSKKVEHLYELCPNAKHKLELVEADLQHPESWEGAVQGCTYVMHVASPFPLSNPKNEMEVIGPAVEGTTSVLKACVKAGTIKRVVLTSSCIAIANKGGNKVPKTEQDWSDLTNATAYGKSKHLAEKAAWDLLNDLPASEKFEMAVINPFFVIGPILHGGGGSSTDLIKQFMTSMPFIPRVNMGTVDVRDVAKAHVICMTLPEAAGNRHILCDKDAWWIEYAEALAKEFNPQGYKVSTSQIPNPILKFASFFSKDLSMLIDAAGEPLPFDNYRMTKILGITPIPLAKSLVDMAYSLIEKGIIKKTAKYRGPPAASSQ